MTRPSIRGFLDRHGVWRELRDPDKPATGRQLAWLNRRGQLDLVPHQHQFEAVTMGEAAHAIDDAVARGYDDDETTRR